MKKFLMVATALVAGAAVAQTAPVAQSAPAAPPAAAAPTSHPMRDKVMTRAETVQMIREHFGQMDSNKDGSVTTAEIDQAHASRMKDFDKFEHRGHAMNMGDPNAAFDRLDADKNGSISRDEFTKAREERIERRVEIRKERQEGKEGVKNGREARQAMRMHRMGGRGGHMIAMADTNKDGRITLAEAESMALRHFDEMDTNKDGQVTREERRAGRKVMFKRNLEEKSGS